MQIDAHNYDEMRAWLGHVAPEVFPDLTPDDDPVHLLDRTAATSPAKARKGLAMAIGDLVEFTEDWSDQQVLALDSSLASKGLPTLSEVRHRFSKVVQRVVRRGRINNDVEYYAIRNVADAPDSQTDLLWKLLTEYEARIA